jgi:putative sterol carrier protein
MALTFPSPEWCAAFKDAVNDNPKYREAGKDWTHGAVAFVVEKDTAIGLPEDAAMVLDVHEGTCRATHWVSRVRAEAEAPFVVAGRYDRWREVLEGREDPIKAMMQNKLRLTKGHLPTIIRYVESSRQLVESARTLESRWLA